MFKLKFKQGEGIFFEIAGMGGREIFKKFFGIEWMVHHLVVKIIQTFKVILRCLTSFATFSAFSFSSCCLKAVIDGRYKVYGMKTERYYEEVY